MDAAMVETDRGSDHLGRCPFEEACEACRVPVLARIVFRNLQRLQAWSLRKLTEGWLLPVEIIC